MAAKRYDRGFGLGKWERQGVNVTYDEMSRLIMAS
jgi:hypothetical protein